MTTTQSIRTLFSRKHDLAIPKLSVFLAGPTPYDGRMTNGWRRKVVQELQKNELLDYNCLVVSPEPESGYWSEIDDRNDKFKIENHQMLWEIQYLKLCDITAFWFPTYWNVENADDFCPNIGPTARWEFGYFLQEYLKDKDGKTCIVGSPEDAQSVTWAKRMAEIHGLRWHSLKKEHKDQLVAPSFIDAIANALIENNWRTKN